MRKYLILLILLIFVHKINAQEIKLHKHNIGLDFGIVKYSLTDKLLNYFKYNSTSFSPLNVHYHFLSENNIHFLDYNYMSVKLSTKQASDIYKYNDINIIDSRLNYEYLHKLTSVKGKLNLYLGCSLSLLGTMINQNYQSYYWLGVKQYAYDFSANFSAGALLQYQRQNGCFMFKIGYAIINYTSRPDDYFIKYGGNLIENQEWKWYSVNGYMNIPISLMYYYDISNRFSIRLEYLSEFREYNADNEFTFLKQSWLSGISFKF